MSDEVHRITIQIKAPRPGYDGKIQIGYYVVVDGFVVLTDEHGRPTGDGKRLLNEGGDARIIACAMLRSSRRYGNSRSGWNDRLTYQRVKY
jgi:hypothetical protein